MTLNDIPAIQEATVPNGIEIQICYTKSFYENGVNEQPPEFEIERDLKCGLNVSLKHFEDGIEAVLDKQYVSLDSFKTKLGLGEIIRLMQGENYSPNGEARELIGSLSNCRHTTIMAGDMIKNKKNGEW